MMSYDPEMAQSSPQAASQPKPTLHRPDHEEEGTAATSARSVAPEQQKGAAGTSAKPFYQTTWFLIAVGVTIVGMVGGLVGGLVASSSSSSSSSPAETPAPTPSPTPAPPSWEWVQLGNDINGMAAHEEMGQSVAVSEDGTIVAMGGEGFSGGAADSLGLVRIFRYNTSNSVWEQLGGDLTGYEPKDRFGISVAMSADGFTVAVGAPNYNINATGDADADALNNTSTDISTNSSSFKTNAGMVRVFQYNQTSDSWEQLGQDLLGTGEYDWFGYAVDMNSNGTVLAVGAPIWTSKKVGAGSVHVFSLVKDEQEEQLLSWVPLGLVIDGEANADSFGESVALSASGKTLAAGATLNDGNGAWSGHVRVHQLVDKKYGGPQWIRRGRDLDGETGGDWFGVSVSISANGEVVAAGAPFNNPTKGHVRVYEWRNGVDDWEQVGQDVDGESSGEYFGYSVALSADGSTFASGAEGVDQARVFRLDSSSEQAEQQEQWERLLEEAGSNTTSLQGKSVGEYFGYSVALTSSGGMNGDELILVVGAPYSNGTEGQLTAVGQVRIFAYQQHTQ